MRLSSARRARSVRTARDGVAQAAQSGARHAVVAKALDSLRNATRRFQSLDSAVAAGYARDVADCLVHEHHGAMGYHHVNRALNDAKVETEHPEILLYERNAGRLLPAERRRVHRALPRLAARLDRAGRARPAHEARGQPADLVSRTRGRGATTPTGLFADFNPAVQCPASASKVFKPFARRPEIVARARFLPSGVSKMTTWIRRKGSQDLRFSLRRRDTIAPFATSACSRASMRCAFRRRGATCTSPPRRARRFRRGASTRADASSTATTSARSSGASFASIIACAQLAKELPQHSSHAARRRAAVRARRYARRRHRRRDGASTDQRDVLPRRRRALREGERHVRHHHAAQVARRARATARACFEYKRQGQHQAAAGRARSRARAPREAPARARRARRCSATSATARGTSSPRAK